MGRHHVQLFSSGSPTAAGTAYLFSSPYTGAPNGLSTATADFLAASTGITDGEYVFASNLTLQPNTAYYLYTDQSLTLTEERAAPLPSPSKASAAMPGSSSSLLLPHRFSNNENVDLDYSRDEQVVVSGTPEPATTGLALGGALLLVAWMRRRRA